jgi:hypothetical protein
MGYNIEISFPLVNDNSSATKQHISDMAIQYECNNYYYLYEMEGKCKIPRNHCIIIINFDDDSIFHCAEFLKTIKKNKTAIDKQLAIECIYEDDIVCKLIYASQYYQTTKMEKDNVIKYNKFKRERSLSDNEKMILDKWS